MALSNADRCRAYRARKRVDQRDTTSTAQHNTTQPDTPTDMTQHASADIERDTNNATRHDTTQPMSELRDMLETYQKQQRRWISDIIDRVAIIEALQLETIQKLNMQHDATQRDATQPTDIPFDQPPKPTRPLPGSREHPRGPISSSMEGFRPLGSVLSTSLKNLPQPPLDNPHGKKIILDDGDC